MKNEISINNLHREELDTRLYDLILEVKIAFGIKEKLNVIIYDDPNYQPNLYGGDRLLITRSVFKKINIIETPEEFKSLIAHECSHISHKDYFYRSIFAAGCIFSFIIVYGLANNIFKNFYISIPLGLVYIIVVGRIFYWRSRMVEFRCDKEAANITKNPCALIEAHKKMYIKFTEVKDTLRIDERIKICVRRCWHFIFGASHPTIDERIKVIESSKIGSL